MGDHLRRSIDGRRDSLAIAGALPMASFANAQSLPGRTNRTRALAVLVASLPFLSGCDPIWSISGAFFPAWLLCMVGGVFAAVLIRWFISRIGVEPHVGPKVIIYSLLYIACTCTLWIAFFSR